MAAVFALASAALFGAGDFFGGMAARRTRVLAIVSASHIIGLALIALSAPFMADTFTMGDFLLGGLAGAFGCVGIACLYHSLGRGPMAVVAPITAVGSAAFPVLWGVVSGERLSTLSLVGILVGFVAIVLVSSTPGHVGRVSRGLLLEAMLAGAGFGGFIITISATSATTTPWPLVAARIVSAGLAMILVLRSGGSPIPRRSDGAVGAIVAAGIFDMAGNLAFLLAVNHGRLSLSATISALYPAMTVLLARTVLGERMSANQIVGMVAAVGAVGLMVGG
jgi:drug/metabolite transporter (DMT)-like permease